MRATSALPPAAAAGPAPKTGRRTLVAIFLVCLAPVLASYFAFYIWHPQASVAHGELIQPPLDMRWDSLPSAAPLRGKWVLALVSASRCDSACATLLYQSRQIRTALDKDMPRVARAWLVEGFTPAESVLAEQPGLLVIPAPHDSVSANFRGRILLIDPYGRLMMQFAPTQDPKLVLKDLQRILKYSPSGRRE